MIHIELHHGNIALQQDPLKINKKVMFSILLKQVWQPLNPQQEEYNLQTHMPTEFLIALSCLNAYILI